MPEGEYLVWHRDEPNDAHVFDNKLSELPACLVEVLHQRILSEGTGKNLDNNVLALDFV